jgi:hypothetical protein
VGRHLACGQRVEERGEGIVLDKRPGTAAEIYATSVVPVHGHANSIGACDVIRQARTSHAQSRIGSRSRRWTSMQRARFSSPALR